MRSNWKIILAGIVVLVLMTMLIVSQIIKPPQHKIEITIPAQSDWVDYGLIFKKGDLGEWDYQMYGGFTATSIKKDGIFYLYYQGASGYRTSYDETVTWRAIGLAASPDGVNFIKAEQNPIIKWFPNHAEEEGGVSGSAFLQDEKIALIYGANTLYSKNLVNADGRLSISNDGIKFTDMGIVLDHMDNDLWGSRDEIFPIIVIQDEGRSVVYYIPNGSIMSGKLGVAWGENFQNLNCSSGVRSGINLVSAWGAGSAARVGEEVYALFLNNGREQKIDVHTVSVNAPQKISTPLRTYQFENVRAASIYLDMETQTWFMYYRNEDGYGLKLAPAGKLDSSPPKPPVEVYSEPLSDQDIELTWIHGIDEESGIVQYQIYRDGEPIAKVKGWRYIDTDLDERTTYEYRVSAINYHGVEGNLSQDNLATTKFDLSPPQIESVSANGDPEEVMVVFNELVDSNSAVDPTNYQVNGIVVDAASLGKDSKSIRLATSGHEPDHTYHLKISNISDQAIKPNRIPPETQASYSYTANPGLVGYWKFDEGHGEIARDTSNFANHGMLEYIEQSGPTWGNGVRGSGLYFDGLDDQVSISDSNSLNPIVESFTFSAWAKSDGFPANTTPNNTYFTILSQDYTGMYYSHAGKFRGHLQLSNGDKVVIASTVVEPGSWHLITFVVDDSNKRIHLFLDGDEVVGSPVEYQGDPADRQGKPLFIGTSDPLKERYEYRFHGVIDEVKVYNQAVFP